MKPTQLRNSHYIRTALCALALTFSAMAADQPPSTNAPAAAPDTTKPAELFADPVLARGKGVEVKRSQLDEAIITFKSTAAASGQMIRPDQMPAVERGELERLLEVQLLMGIAQAADKAKGQEACDKQLELMKARAVTDESLNRQLKSVGLTQETLKAKMYELATAEIVLDRELKITISDEEMKKYYDENPALFEQPEMLRVSHLLLNTRDEITRTELAEDKKTAKHKQLEDLLKRARGGEDFTKLVKEFSEDIASRTNGGEYTFGRNQMPPEFESAAFALTNGQISDIVTTQYGYHIIKLSEKIPPKKVEMAKVSVELQKRMKQRAIAQKLPEFMDKLKKDANVEILDEKLKPLPGEALATPSPVAAPPKTGGK